MTSTRRQSSIELLRIISMMMVLAVHIDGASLGLPELEGDFARLTARPAWQLGVESLAIIGVNCFTLISGYFSIRLKVRSLASFLFQCVFYSVGLYAVMCIAAPGRFSFGGLIESFMILTHTDLWYVPAYFLLMLVAPLLNAGFDRLPRRHALYLTLALTAYNVWAGWLWGGSFNPSGYTVVQLIMIYCIGRTISLYRSELTGRLRRPALAYLGLYLGMTLATAVFACYDPAKAFAYNQPTVILASVSFFLCFASIDFSSRAVNYAARSAFAVYLIHKNPAVWGGVMKPGVVGLWNQLTLWQFSLAAVGLIAAIYLATMAVDPLRRFISSAILGKR